MNLIDFAEENVGKRGLLSCPSALQRLNELEEWAQLNGPFVERGDGEGGS